MLIMSAFTFLLLISLSHASYVKVIEPYNYTLYNNNTVYLGQDGPGQTFFITISAATTNSTGALLPEGWDKLIVTGLPSGWIAQNSSLYNPTLSVKITPAPNAANGTYRFNLTAINIGNYSKLGAVTFTAYVNVTPDVFKLSAYPSTIVASTGTPTQIQVSINNTGVSDTLFLINITGLPAFNQTAQVIALHHTVQNFSYTVYASEPGEYHANLNVRSISSPLVYQETNITIISKASILNDYSAIGGGVVAFPIIFQPLYGVMYLISRIFRSQ
jgi:hypothetical protein